MDKAFAFEPRGRGFESQVGTKICLVNFHSGPPLSKAVCLNCSSGDRLVPDFHCGVPTWHMLRGGTRPLSR